MKEGKCPLLEITAVAFCKAYPVKMIPLDKGSSTSGICHTSEFHECALYKERSKPYTGVESVRGFLLKSDYYLHPRHVWVSPSEENENGATLGIDDFCQKLIGKIDRVTIPSEGSTIKENAVCFLLHSGQRTVKMVSPVDGIIKTVNSKLASDPSVINRDPYDEGWLFTMHVHGEGLKGLFFGDSAKRWLTWEVERLQRTFSSELGLTATDGGESLSDISSKLTEAQWSRVINQFIG